MPTKTGFIEGIKEGLVMGLLGAGIGTVIVGGITALISMPAVPVAAAIGAFSFGTLATVIDLFAHGMGDDDNVSAVSTTFITTLAITAGCYFGLGNVLTPKVPSKNTIITTQTSATSFNAQSGKKTLPLTSLNAVNKVAPKAAFSVKV